jgi:hypothetical protein
MNSHMYHRQTHSSDPPFTRFDQPQSPTSAVLHMAELSQIHVVFHARDGGQLPVKLIRHGPHFKAQPHFACRPACHLLAI